MEDAERYGTEYLTPIFQAVFQTAVIGMAVLRPNGRLIVGNPAFAKLTGCGEDEWGSVDLQDLLHTGDAGEISSMLRRLGSGTPPREERKVRILHWSGRLIWANLHLSVLDQRRYPDQDADGPAVGPAEGHTDGNGDPSPLVLAQLQDITAHMATEERYRSLIVYNPAAISVIDSEGTILTANRMMEELTGYTAEELVGTRLSSILTEFDSTEIVRFDGRAEACGKEAVLTGKDGTPILHIGLKRVPVYIDGRLEGFHVVCRDITPLKLAEFSLQQKEQDLKDIVRLQDGMTFKVREENGSFIHTMCDGALLQRLGSVPDDIIGRTVFELLPEQEAIRKEACYRRAWQGEERVLYEGRIGEITYLASLRPIRRNGRVVEVIGACVDISERKLMEEELRSTKEQLESFIHNISDAFDLLDPQGRVIQVNAAFERMFGWKGEEIIGRRLPIMPEALQDDLLNFMENIKAGASVYNYETVRLRKDGSLVDVSLSITPIKNAEGRIMAYAALCRDITEQKQTEELLRKSDKLSVAGQLAAGLAHEIRNPLTALQGFLQLLRKGIPGKHEYYEIMQSELERINGIVTEFLYIAKPQATHYKSCNINAILERVVTLLDAQAILNNIRIRVAAGEDLPDIYCDEAQIKQVCINILKNAIEAMEKGGDIVIRSRTAGGQLILSISDQGCGIPKERLPFLGEPFYSTKDKGTGLGLMMCYKIMEAHGGSFSLRNNDDIGTTAEIRLPLAGGG